MNKYDVVKLKDSDKKGIIMIKEKQLRDGSYSLNYILLEDESIKMLESDRFEIIGEIEIDD